MEEEFGELCDELDELVLREVYELDASAEDFVDDYLKTW